MIRSAPTPAGWPDLTPINQVRVKEYPAYRAASVRAGEPGGDPMGEMFMELFRHIQRNDIAMTAPVDMGYAKRESESPRLQTMAFLYRTQELGTTGADGAVHVDDVAAQSHATVGLRGDYTTENYVRGLAILEQWLEVQREWTPTGPPRYLGYNSPFVPWFARYAEVLIPVERAE